MTWQPINTIAVRSILDPSRILTYSDKPGSVLGLGASDHVLVHKDRIESAMLGSAPFGGSQWPITSRWTAIKAVAHVLMHLINPWSRPALINQHLQQHGRGEVSGLGCGEHGVLVQDHRFELFNNGHALVLRVNRSPVTLP